MTTQDSRHGGTVIAFPGSPDRRLALALAKLDAALGTQRTAIERFRHSLGALGDRVGGLEQGLVRYRTALDTLSTNIAGLHRHAGRLEEAADRAMPRSSA